VRYALGASACVAGVDVEPVPCLTVVAVAPGDSHYVEGADLDFANGPVRCALTVVASAG
jgi:hypothetical protein